MMEETQTQKLIRISTGVFLLLVGVMMALLGLPFVFSFDFKVSTVGLSLVACGVYLIYLGYTALFPSNS